MKLRRLVVLLVMLVLACLSSRDLGLVRGGYTPAQAASGSYKIFLPLALRGPAAAVLARQEGFAEIAQQGFGDRQNSYAWAMQWWRGKLYVGTARSLNCVEKAALVASAIGFLDHYPPDDPDIACASTPQDLPLRAEIWRYTPGTDTWNRVYQSPEDVPIPGHPGKYVARDIGFRDMAVFTEPNGTEVLYISGVSSRPFNGDVPPPRLLRTSDGINFAAVPQDHGTVFGSLPQNAESMRTLKVHNGRLYLVVGSLYGDGALYESANPAGGNDSWRKVSPDGMRVYEFASFNGSLYIGTRNWLSGFEVMKLIPSASPPYTFQPIITRGGEALLPAPSAVSMFAYKDRLYIGTDGPGELVRVNPDDSWDLIVGLPRNTWSGHKEPLSGMGPGFDWFFNWHMYRMEQYRGELYIGTVDASTWWRQVPLIGQFVAPQAGFDLFKSKDGVHFAQVTHTGFGDKFNIAARTLVDSPYGLFLGTGNYYYGLRIYLKHAPSAQEAQREQVSLTAAEAPPEPEQLAAEVKDGHVILSWDAPAGVTRFHIFRSEFTRPPELQNLPDLLQLGMGGEIWIPGEFQEIGTTERAFFVDTQTSQDKRYHYYIQAESADGHRSSQSNTARIPSLQQTTTFHTVGAALAKWSNGQTDLSLTKAQAMLRAENFAGAREQLAMLDASVSMGGAVQSKAGRADDLKAQLQRFEQRITLCEAGLLSVTDLE